MLGGHQYVLHSCALCNCSELSIFWVEQRLSSCLPWEELLPSSFIRAALIMLMTLLLFHLPFSRLQSGDPGDWPH